MSDEDSSPDGVGVIAVDFNVECPGWWLPDLMPHTYGPHVVPRMSFRTGCMPHSLSGLEVCRVPPHRRSLYDAYSVMMVTKEEWGKCYMHPGPEVSDGDDGVRES